MKQFNECQHCHKITKKQLEIVEVNEPIITVGVFRDCFMRYMVCPDCVKEFEND